MAWLAGGYSKRKALKLTGGASGALTDHQLKITVSYAAAMQGDFDDLRFTQADGTTLVDAWAEVIVADTSAVVWVEFPTTPANTVEQTYYMYYGNAGGANYWDIGTTFVLGDDFDISSPWTEVDPNSHIIQDRTTDKRLEVAGLSRNEDAYLYASRTTDSTVVYAKAKVTSANSGQVLGIVGISDTLNDMANWQNGANAYFYYSPHRIDLAGYSGGSRTVASINISVNTDYWIKMTLIGTTATLYVYSDSAMQNLVGSVNRTIGDVSYSYVYSAMSYNSGTATGGDFLADDIRVRKYAANPPTYEFGAEESEPTGEAAPTSIFYGPFVGPLGGTL